MKVRIRSRITSLTAHEVTFVAISMFVLTPQPLKRIRIMNIYDNLITSFNQIKGNFNRGAR